MSTPDINGSLKKRKNYMRFNKNQIKGSNN